MSEKPIYVGHAKRIGENGLKISICLSDLPKEHIEQSTKNGKKYINLVTFPVKEGNEKEWMTHSLKVDTWKPKEQESPDDGLPF